MRAGEAARLAEEWVEREGSQVEDFAGAHLMGGINELAPDQPFPGYTDVDVSILLEGEHERENLEVAYRGLMLEVGYRGLDLYESAEKILANPVLAPHLAADSILSDPQHILERLHKTVAAEYARRRWVVARIEQEEQWLHETLQQPQDPFTALLFALLYLSGLIAVADLRIPTHRRALILLKEVLGRKERLDLHEEVLALLGSQDVSRQQAKKHLQALAETFDRAVTVYETPFPGSFKLRDHLRPYVVDASRAMIDAGHHREAMIWIWGMLMVANTAVQNDGPEGEGPHYQAHMDRLLRDLGLTGPEAFQARLQEARHLSGTFYALAQEIVDGNAAIMR